MRDILGGIFIPPLNKVEGSKLELVKLGCDSNISCRTIRVFGDDTGLNRNYSDTPRD